jgi:hypothetical protein
MLTWGIQVPNKKQVYFIIYFLRLMFANYIYLLKKKNKSRVRIKNSRKHQIKNRIRDHFVEPKLNLIILMIFDFLYLY